MRKDETQSYAHVGKIRKARGIYLWPIKKSKRPFIDLVQGYSTTIFGNNDDNVLRYIKRIIEEGVIDHVCGIKTKPLMDLDREIVRLSSIKCDAISDRKCLCGRVL